MCLSRRQLDPKTRRIQSAGNLCLASSFVLVFLDKHGFGHRPFRRRATPCAFCCWASPSVCSTGPRAAAAAAPLAPERSSYVSA